MKSMVKARGKPLWAIGPYKFAEWTGDNNVRLEYFEDY